MHRSLRIGGGSNSDPGSMVGFRTRPYDGKIAGLYDLEETLGRGHFAVVKLARHVFTGEKVAVKVIDKSKLDEVSKAHLFQEVRCMKLVQHPNVVRLYEVIDTATKLYLILELGDGGDLYEYILRHDSGLPEEMAQEYFRQIVKAISYCHQLHVVHRDLKPENVVFFKKLGIVKLTDFGFSNKFYPGQKLETSCGSLAYSAPEILLGDSYDAPAVDVWSLGVILYMLVCGQPPFQEANDSETLTMIMDCKYNVPPHVSNDCKDLIARMLVKNPEKRASLADISSHPWLGVEKQENLADVQPLVAKEHLSEEDHNLIVQKIVNGNIATKEEIQESLDKNEYNHITATYYLLAERKLRAKRQQQDQIGKSRRPEFLAVAKSAPAPKKDNNGTAPNSSLLSVPRTPGDVPARSRKCSIVQEDEEEEDISSCSGREDLNAALNRRGSRSEGRLNLALQERLAEADRRKQQQQQQPAEKTAEPLEKRRENGAIPGTTVITDCSTISIPIVAASGQDSVPKYKTMPSPTINKLLLNEIFEEDCVEGGCYASGRQFASRAQNRTPYEQRRSKFHKSRTASCSSSDASDDDSEKRKKRAHKLNASAKPFQGRRDSHDDSSDSQEPGNGCGATGNAVKTAAASSKTAAGQGDGNKNNGGGGKNTGGRNCATFTRRHKNNETRLRESQSLNRITEVQEEVFVAAAAVVTATPKAKGFTARLLQGINVKIKSGDDKSSHVSRRDTLKALQSLELKDEKSGLKMKKMRILGKYFQVHRKLFGRERLYKAQSCGSLAVGGKVGSGGAGRQRAASAAPSNENENNNAHRRKSGGHVHVIRVSDVCATHLGPASKCCSFC
ncbi:unnamed protein product [Brassicogethes aeneus]|uniref:SNF-related serine/threonine-protein kinase n=1 Tax=Brassicogethes aeneus TaxID=1431903 RepID=A0A9P0F8K6_BRAAE|nr:unnamed protein product [Brassicogethes aeneus]